MPNPKHGGRYIIDEEGKEPRRVDPNSDEHHTYPKAPPAAEKAAEGDKPKKGKD